MKRRPTKKDRRKAAARDAEIERLRAENARLRAENAELKARLEKLERLVASLQKDSSTSSKPPSSDIVKPSKATPKVRGKRRAGGQRGHEKHERTIQPEEVDERHGYVLDACPKGCASDLVLMPGATKTHYQYELVDKPVRLHAHQLFGCYCPECDEVHYDVLPPEVRNGGLVGPQLRAAIAYLKGGCHSSYTTTQSFVSEVLGVPLSTGMIAKIIERTSRALDAPYVELLARLPNERTMNIDETGHKERGEKFWTWCFRARLYTLFRIDKSRGSEVLIDVLGKEFDGVLGCDYFSAYRKFMGDFDVRVQFCLAHLIRDIKFLLKLDAVSKNFANRLLEKIRALFRLIHRRENMTPERFQAQLEKARAEILKVGKRAPMRVEAQNIADRFRKHGKAYFEFITTPGIDPTNNLAEQAIRFVVIDRKVTQGTRGPTGRQWCERIWTTIATCTQQSRSVFGFLHEAISAFFQGHPAPSLLPDTT
jgi:transposase